MKASESKNIFGQTLYSQVKLLHTAINRKSAKDFNFVLKWQSLTGIEMFLKDRSKIIFIGRIKQLKIGTNV